MKYTNTLVINTGSTSVKYKLFNYKGAEVLAENFDNKLKGDKKKEDAFLRKIKSLAKTDDLKVAFRVVHGGDILGPVVLDKSIEKRIKEFASFAPIHNKIVLKKIAKMKKFFQKSFDQKQFFAVFDTDFHQTIPEIFSTYPMDQKIAKKYKLKKYGFHGIAVQSALNKIKDGFEKRKKDLPEKIIFAHLGGGSSLTAVKSGKSVANTMGLTPISGIMMTTRVGDVDSDLDKILAQKMGKSINIISDMFSKKSGFLGLTGSSDTRDILEKAQKEEKEKRKEFKNEKLAFDIYISQIIQKIGAFTTLMGGIDLIVFSGGIGEGNSYLRKEILDKIKFLGIEKENILTVRVDEELEIFEQIKEL